MQRPNGVRSGTDQSGFNSALPGSEINIGLYNSRTFANYGAPVDDILPKWAGNDDVNS